MRDSVVEFIRLELNHNIRNTNKILSFIERFLLNTYKKYQFTKVEYISNQATRNAFNIHFQTFRNKLICFNVTEYNDGYYISMPFIIKDNPYDTIRYYDYCQQRNLIELSDRINKLSYLGNNLCSIIDIKMGIEDYIKAISNFFNLEELDKILHTDYWPDDIIYDWRIG